MICINPCFWSWVKTRAVKKQKQNTKVRSFVEAILGSWKLFKFNSRIEKILRSAVTYSGYVSANILGFEIPFGSQDFWGPIFRNQTIYWAPFQSSYLKILRKKNDRNESWWTNGHVCLFVRSSGWKRRIICFGKWNKTRSLLIQKMIYFQISCRKAIFFT